MSENHTARAEQPGQVVLACRDIGFAYGERPILEGISLELRSGEILGLLGPNGTGKSTLLGVLAGDLMPDRGKVDLFGRPLSAFERRELARTRSVMPQASEFPFSYLVYDIVAMGRSCWNEDPDVDEVIIGRSMELTEVTDLVDRDVTRLSGGEKARVTLARVLAQKARVVFLDEPTAALDISHQERTMELCVSLAKAGCGVVTVMHDIQLAAAYCDRIAVMSSGGVASIGTPSQVITSELLTRVYNWPIDVRTLADGELVILPRRTGSPRRKEN
ncbi:MAG: heme ABC transporter ATP-binding protein [Flaviflexus sp.]|nr:heme ABC transporter ATP-binding protein [Flaviflexus sp.]